LEECTADEGRGRVARCLRYCFLFRRYMDTSIFIVSHRPHSQYLIFHHLSHPRVERLRLFFHPFQSRPVSPALISSGHHKPFQFNSPILKHHETSSKSAQQIIQRPPLPTALRPITLPHPHPHPHPLPRTPRYPLRRACGPMSPNPRFRLLSLHLRQVRPATGSRTLFDTRSRGGRGPEAPERVPAGWFSGRGRGGGGKAGVC